MKRSSSFCNDILNYCMSSNVEFVKRILGRKITLHPQSNRMPSRMSPSYHIQKMEVQSGSKKKFLFNLGI